MMASAFGSIVCALLVTCATAASAACLKANTEGQTVSGKLTVAHAKDGMGRLERPFILRLATSACLDADDPEEAVKTTRTIHIFPADEAMLPKFRKLVGKEVAATGSPFAAHTVHHHAPIVMQIKEIRAR
ncbi:MAG: DUF4431 domain-containing protein [Bradyrhizobium sp.]|nr:DUF4431 domain-containing protein [Bradyrhizobium sp.]